MANDRAASGQNEFEHRRWNDAHWTDYWPARERLTSSVTPYLFRIAALHSGDRVLDVGCGGGGTTIASAALVGPTGNVVGADLSSPLLELAKNRAQAGATSNLAFVEADMQSGDVSGRPFDVAISQFGVMFFDEPVVAFGNIRDHLCRGGRIAFACWQSVTQNPWHIGAVLSPLMAPAPTSIAGKSPTGPFTLGDQLHTRSILTAAGFEQISFDGFELEVEVPAITIVDRSELEFLGVTKDNLTRAEELIAEHLERFRVGDDRYRVPLSFAIYKAINP